MKSYLEQVKDNGAGTDQVQSLNLNIFCFILYNFISSLSEWLYFLSLPQSKKKQKTDDGVFIRTIRMFKKTQSN